jgi:hypothetical protein
MVSVTQDYQPPLSYRGDASDARLSDRQCLFVGAEQQLLVAEGAVLGEQFLHVPVAQREAEIKPDRVLNDFGRKAMAAIRKLGHGSW